MRKNHLFRRDKISKLRISHVIEISVTLCSHTFFTDTLQLTRVLELHFPDRLIRRVLENH